MFLKRKLHSWQTLCPLHPNLQVRFVGSLVEQFTSWSRSNPLPLSFRRATPFPIPGADGSRKSRVEGVGTGGRGQLRPEWHRTTFWTEDLPAWNRGACSVWTACRRFETPVLLCHEPLRFWKFATTCACSWLVHWSVTWLLFHRQPSRSSKRTFRYLLYRFVQVKTGEEDEEVMFQERCRLFRWDENQWKERGVGEIKLLRRLGSEMCRLVMRRDQVIRNVGTVLVTMTHTHYIFVVLNQE